MPQSGAGCSAANAAPLDAGLGVSRSKHFIQRNSKRRPFAGRLFVLIGMLIGGRKVSWRRSGLKAISPAPICGQQIGQMRVQKSRSPKKRTKKEKTTKHSRGRVSFSKKA
jgi:hypothetical protein